MEAAGLSFFPFRKSKQIFRLVRKIVVFLSSQAMQDHMDISYHFIKSRMQYVFHPLVGMVGVPILLSLCWQKLLILLSYTSTPGAVTGVGLFLALAFTVYLRLKPSPCYLVDFCCTKSRDENMINMEFFEYFMHSWGLVEERNLQFQFKVFLRSGIGEEAYAPRRLLEKGQSVELDDAREETEDLIYRAVKQLLMKTGVEPKDVDIVILNSSLFCPVPSLTAYLVNRFKMRSNVKSYNLAGMGCSAGLISVDLAKDLLKVNRDSYAVVVSTENLSHNFYFGNDRSMMVSNCLFRCGASAILLTNKTSEKRRAKLELVHCSRTHNGANDESFKCVTHREDDKGALGVSLQVSLTEVAAKVLRANLTKLAPMVLPSSELLKVLVNLVKRSVFKMQVKPYEPNFKRAFKHFCIHPGGRAVIDSIGKGLKLSELDMEPGRMALHRFGNTSSSGIWYALAYCEAKDRLKKGDNVWQIGLGSGFKCNSGVWRVLRDIHPSNSTACNPWMECIHRYPVRIPAKVPESHPYAWVMKEGSEGGRGRSLAARKAVRA